MPRWRKPVVRTRAPIRTRAPRLLGAVIALAALGLWGCEPQPEEPEATGPPEATEDGATPPAEEEPPAPPDDEHPEAAPPEDDRDAISSYGVSAEDPDAVRAGMDVLADGGNAVEAAIATAYAVSVTEPFGSGVGGGGAAIVAEPGEDPVAWDYRVVANQSGEIPATDTGIPGFVAGMEALHEAYGEGELAELIEPAIALAEDGTQASPMLSDQLQITAHRLPVDDLPHFFPDGAAIAPGEPLVQPELAETLRAVAAEGAGSFYGGDLAGQLADRVDGIDTGSLAAYEIERPEAATGRFGEYEVVSAAPSLTGPMLVQMVQIAEALGVGDHEPGSADHVHALAMAGRIADRFRLEVMGDPAFVDVPLDELTDAGRNAALSEQVSVDSVLDVAEAEPYGGLETDTHTTHLTVVDVDGTVVSMTNTLSNLWGSGQHELGFFLNDQLRNFVDDEGSPNQPEPGKRTVAHSTPTVVVDDEGRPVLGLGSPGGPRIPHVLAQVLTRWAMHGEGLAEAVEAPRFHLDGEALIVEEPPPAEVVEDLLGRGYAEVTDPPFPYYFGSVQALEVDHDAGELAGAADARRGADWQAATP